MAQNKIIHYPAPRQGQQVYVPDSITDKHELKGGLAIVKKVRFTFCGPERGHVPYLDIKGASLHEWNWNRLVTLQTELAEKFGQRQAKQRRLR